jgi:hypothetical protein
MRSGIGAGAAVLAALAALAGCGGESEPELFRLGPTRACLDGANIPVRVQRLDFVASTASGGALHALLPPNEVTLAFGASEAEAQRLGQAYRRFAGANIPVDDVLYRARNVVLLWVGKPGDFELERVTDCLDG